MTASWATLDQNPWTPSAEGGAALAGKEACVGEEGQRHWMAAMGPSVEVHLAVAAAAIAAVSSAPEKAGSHSLRL